MATDLGQSGAPAGQANPPGRFAPGEVGEVLRCYELGRIASVRELLGGDAGSPKALVDCARGRFVLKRRAPGRDNPFRVAMTHEVMLHLRSRGFCAPALIGTRTDNNSLLQLEGRVYELFVFVEGEPYARTPAQARAIGACLKRMHDLLASFTPRFADPPVLGSPMTIVRRGVLALGSPPQGARLESLCERAEQELDIVPMNRGGEGLLHGDFHPGNLLFRGKEVACVFDFEGLRRGPCAVDLAQAMVQSGMVRAEGGPSGWPEETDLGLSGALWAGYTRTGGSEGGTGSGIDPAALPSLMALSLGVEWADGATGGLLGPPAAALEMLDAVVRKAQWLLDHAGQVRAGFERA